MFILIFVGIIIMGGMVYLAVSRKSGTVIRIAALCAMALMIVAVIVSLIVIFGIGKSSAVIADEFQEAPPTPAPPVQETNVMALVLFVIFLIALFLLVLVISLREQRRRVNTQEETESRK